MNDFTEVMSEGKILYLRADCCNSNRVFLEYHASDHVLHVLCPKCWRVVHSIAVKPRVSRDTPPSQGPH